MKKIAINTLLFAVLYTVFSIIGAYGVIYSLTTAKMFAFGISSFVLVFANLYYHTQKNVLLINQAGYLGKPYYVKVAIVCLFIGIVMAAVGSILRISVCNIFAEYYSGLTDRMHTSLIYLYSTTGMDVEGLKQEIHRQKNLSIIQIFFEDVLLTFKFSVVVSLILPFVLKKKLKAGSAV